MVKRSLRTRSRKKVKLKTPGGRNVTHFRSEKPGKATCGQCGTQLSGVTTGSPAYMSNLAGSQKVPARPYAGVLCPKCLDALVRYVTRMEVKQAVPELAGLKVQRDLTIEKFLPRGWYGNIVVGGVLRKRVKKRPKAKAKSKEKSKAAEKPKKAKKAK